MKTSLFCVDSVERARDVLAAQFRGKQFYAGPVVADTSSWERKGFFSTRCTAMERTLPSTLLMASAVLVRTYSRDSTLLLTFSEKMPRGPPQDASVNVMKGASLFSILWCTRAGCTPHHRVISVLSIYQLFFVHDDALWFCCTKPVTPSVRLRMESG